MKKEQKFKEVQGSWYPWPWLPVPDGWIAPDDPLYTLEQWKNIKATLGQIDNETWYNIHCMLKVAVGTYRAAIMFERPEPLVKYKFESDKYRRKLDRVIKIFQNLKKILAAELIKDRRTQKACMESALATLSDNQFCGKIHDDGNLAVNVEIAQLIDWLKQNAAPPTISVRDFDAAINRVIHVLEINRNAASKSRPPVKQARNILMQRLDDIWCLATGEEPTSYRDCSTGKFVSRFGGFVETALVPVGKQWDRVDTGALGSAVWDYVNKKRCGAKT